MLEKNSGLNKFFTKVYMWMFIGLLISGGVAYYTSVSEVMLSFVLKFYIFIVISELVMVISFTSLRNKVSPEVAKMLFIIYSALSGLTLSTIFIIYKIESIGMVFLASAIMFGLLAIYGFITKQDLSSFGKILLFGLISAVIMSIINIFIGNSAFDIFISIISIVIFLGLTAYDMNRLKQIYMIYADEHKILDKVSIYGALDLYLDFVNILLKLLRLFGRRKN